MTRLGDLAAYVAANKQQAEEFSAYILASRDLANELRAALAEIGLKSKAAKISGVATQLGEAENSRWLAAGHLEDALLIINSVIEGSSGHGAFSNTSEDPARGAITRSITDYLGPEGSGTVRANSDGTYSLLSVWSSNLVEVRLLPPDAEGGSTPTGNMVRSVPVTPEATEQTEDRSRHIRRGAKAAATKADDFQAGAKAYTNAVHDMLAALDPPSKETIASTGQDSVPLPSSPTTGQGPNHGVDVGELGANVAVWAIAGVMTVAKLKKETRRDDS